jgi:hypothetical protein
MVDGELQGRVATGKLTINKIDSAKIPELSGHRGSSSVLPYEM